MEVGKIKILKPANLKDKSVCNYFRMVAHFVAVLFTGFIIYTACTVGSSLFVWHPCLMTFAFAFLMFEGVLVFSPQSSIVQKLSRAGKVQVHWILQVAAVVAALLGFGVIYYNKYLNNKSHFTSWHGTIGLVTIIYMCIQIMGGTFVKYPKILSRFKLTPASLKKYHATSGIFAFTFICASLFLGLNTTWFTTHVTGTSWYGCISCVSCTLFIVGSQVTNNYLPTVQKK